MCYHRRLRIANTVTTWLVVFSLLASPGYSGGKAAAAPPQAQEGQSVSPVITLTNSDVLAVDQDGDGQVEPGDTLRYTLTAANPGSASAAGVTLVDVLDDSLTLVPGSLRSTPLAYPQSVSALEDGGEVPFTLLGADFDGDTLTYSVETAPVYGMVDGRDNSMNYRPTLADFFGDDSLTFQVCDSAAPPNCDSAAVSVTIQPVNDPPSFTSGGSVTVLEDSGNFLSAWASSISAGPANESGQTVSFTVSSDNDSLFSAQPAISAAGNLSFAPAADAFGSAVLTVTLSDNGGTANDGRNTSASQTMLVDVIPVNDQPSFTSGGDVSVMEDAPAQTIDSWAAAISSGPYEIGQALQFTVTGNTNPALFAAGPEVSPDGTLTFTPTADTFGAAQITLRLVDNGGTANGGADTSPAQTFTISVLERNDAPSVDPTGFDVDENSPDGTLVGAVTFSDGEPGQTHTFAITAGDPDGVFTIDASSGEIRVDNPTLLDYEITPTFALTVTVTDSAFPPASGSAAVDIQLNDVNDAPQVSPITFSLPENSADEAVVGSVTATDQDAGQKLAFSITAGNTGGAFAIDSTGQIRVDNPSALDFETIPTFTLTVQAADNGSSARQGEGTITVNLSDINEAPEITAASYSVDEYSLNGSWIGAAPMSDPDVGQTHVFAITEGDNDGAFAIDSDGDITVADTTFIDFSVISTYTLTVQATDNGSPALSGSGTITISVNDVNDAPVVNAAEFSVDENSSDGVLLGSVTYTDRDAGQLHTFAITAGNEDGAFAIDPDSGALTTAGSLDYENHPTYSLTVAVTDNGSPVETGTATVTVNLNNLNEPPAVSPTSFNLPENSGEGVVVGTLVVTDPENAQTHTFAITAGDGSCAFAVSAAGQVTSTGEVAFDHETLDFYDLQITVTDGGSPTQSTVHDLRINITDVNEAPTLDDDIFTVDENPAQDAVLATLAVSDPDAGQEHAFEILNGNASGAFAVNSDGEITAADPSRLNFEATQSFTITVRATDNGSPALNDTAVITINLNDINEAPVVGGDSYQTVGNTLLEVSETSTAPTPRIFFSGDLLENDSDPDAGDHLRCELLASTPGAVVNVASDGTFTYLPPAGDASDSFTYRAIDDDGLSTTGTVTVTMQGMVWYVKNDSAAGGLGRSTDPFDTLSEAYTASAVNDTIYIYYGDGSAAGQNAGISLKSGQRLIGSGVALDVPVSVNGAASPTTLLGSGQQPHIDNVNPVGAGVYFTGGAEIRGLNLAGGENAVYASCGGTACGPLVIANNTIRSAGAEGIDINLSPSSTLTVSVQDNTIASTGAGFNMSVTSGTVSLDFTSNTVTAGSSGININRSGGTLTITGFSGNQVGGDVTGSGAAINGALFDSVPGDSDLDPINLGSFLAGVSGNPVGGAGLSITNAEGSLRFSQLNIYSQGGTGLNVSGAYPATRGGLTLNIDSGQGTVNTSGAAALALSSLAVTAPNLAVTTSASAAGGASFTTVTGSLSTTAGSSLAVSSGTGFLVNGGSADLTHNGTLTVSGGRAVEIHNRSAGSATFSGLVNASGGTGVSLHDNTGGTVTFNGGLTLSTSTNTAFYANNGGTLAVTGSANTITTTTGQALVVRSSTIAASGLTFRSISAGATSTAVELNNTGVLGGLTVTGTGSAGTGGTISNTTGDTFRLADTRNISLNYMTVNNAATSGWGPVCGSETAADCASAVDLYNATNITLNRIEINGSGQMGVSGYQVSGLTLTNVIITNAGNSNDEYALLLHNPSGVVLVQDSNFNNMYETGFRLYKDGGALLNLTLRRAAFSYNNAAAGEDGFQFKLAGSAAANILVDDSDFTHLQRDGIDGTYQDSSILNLTVNATSFENNNGLGGILVAGNNTASGYLNLTSNIVRNTVSTAITLTSALNARMDATVTGNTIEHPAMAATQVGEGIRLSQEDDSDMTVLLQNNNISGMSQRGVAAYSRLAATNGALNVTAHTNTVQPPRTDFIYGMEFNVQDANHTLCLDISGNNATGYNAPGIRVRNSAGTFQLEGATLGLLDATQAASFINGQNTSNQPASASLGAGMNFTGVLPGTCPSPTSAVQPSASLYQGAQMALGGRAAGPARLLPPALQAAGETVEVNIGALPVGKSVTVTFEAVIDPDLPADVYQVSNQAAAYGSNFTQVWSDDPATPGETGDSTLTDLYRSPTAVDDLFTLNEDSTFTAPAPGVLSNDLASAGYALTAELVTSPSAGSLTLNPDGSFVYTPAANATGDQTFTYRTSDSAHFSAPALATLRITPVNDAPVLDPNGNMHLSPVGSGDSVGMGTLVRDIITSAGGDRITDIDPGAMEGIAVAAADTAHGAWQYTTTGGLTWANLGAPSDSAARLLAADSQTRLRFVASGGFTGAVDPAVTFYAWDRSSGSNGASVDASTRGGTTPFSTASETASITVNPAADLQMALYASETDTLAGNQVIFSMQVSNAGPGAAQAVTAGMNLPAGWSLVETSAGCTTAGDAITCAQAALNSGETASFDITAAAGVGVSGPVNVSASAASGTFDFDLANNTASVTVTVNREFELLRPDDPPDPALWSAPITTQPACGSAFIGEFNNQTVDLSLVELPQHTTVTIEFDLLILRSWDGNETSRSTSSPAAWPYALPGSDAIGPDVWSLSVDEQPLLTTTFSNWEDYGFRQAYPSAYPGGSHPSRTGASKVNSLCYKFGTTSQDTVYHMRYTIPHDQTNLILSFSASGLQAIADESWGLDNVTVRLSSGADLKPNKIYLPEMRR